MVSLQKHQTKVPKGNKIKDSKKVSQLRNSSRVKLQSYLKEGLACRTEALIWKSGTPGEHRHECGREGVLERVHAGRNEWDRKSMDTIEMSWKCKM